MKETGARRLLAAAALALALLGCGSPEGRQPRPVAPEAGSPSTGGVGKSEPGSEIPSDRILVRTGRLELTVVELGPAVEAATALANRMGGFVASSSVREEDGRRTAMMTLRVPAPRYDEAMGELRRLAVEVDEETSTAQDVTEEHVDLNARLRNLEATEQQYLELLKRAQSVEDLLKVQQRLGEVRTQIDQIRGRLQLLQRRVDLSQIELTLRPQADAGFRPLRYAREAWAVSLRSIEGAIGVLVATWWLWLLAVAGWWLIRRRRRRGRAAPPAAGPAAG